MKSLSLILILYFGFVQPFSSNKYKSLDSLLKVAETAKDTAFVNSLIKIATVYKYKDTDTALYYLNIAEKEAQKSGYVEGYLNAVFKHGNILYKNNNYSEAKDYFTRGLKFSEKKNNKLFKARFLERLASIHLATDNSNLALKLYYESLVIFEDINDRRGIAKVYNILGIYKAETGEFDLAETYLKKSLKIHQQLNDTNNIIENKGNLGYLYGLAGDIDKEEATYLELIPLLRQVNNTYALSVIYENIASIKHTKGLDNEAIGFLMKSIRICEQTKDTALLCSLYETAGDHYFEKRLIDSSKIYLNKSLICCRAIKQIKTEIQSLMLIAKIDSLAGDINSEISTYKRILMLKDTIFQQKLENSMQESELRYENLKNENKIEFQEKIIRSNEKNQWLFIILFIISTITVVLMAWLFILQKKSIYKNKKLHIQEIKVKELEIDRAHNEEKLQKLEKERIEEELKVKERELVSLAMQMDQSKMELNFVRQRIKELARQESINSDELGKLNKAILIKLKDRDNWDLFYKTFNEVHKDFFKKLKDKHPALTKSELKHCAYIRIHLSSNQISSLLNVSIEAVRKTRYRLRKKLELDPNDSLEDYLLKF